MTSANKSLEKNNFPSGWTCYKTIGSYVSCVFIEIWSTWKFEEHSRSYSCSRLRLEQLLRIFRALQTSRVLHISMDARWRMNQLLNSQGLRSIIRSKRKYIRKNSILTRSVRQLRKNTKKLTYKKRMLTFKLIWTRKEYSKWTCVTNNKRLRNATPRTKNYEYFEQQH